MGDKQAARLARIREILETAGRRQASRLARLALIAGLAIAGLTALVELWPGP